MVKVIIIGAGRIAGLNEEDPVRLKPCTHAGAYVEHVGFDLVGVVDINAEAGRAFGQKFDIPFYLNVHQALKELKPDHISVTVPYAFHEEAVISCVMSQYRPKSIFCEKPISNSLVSAKRMVKTCYENEVLLFVNNRRLETVYQLIKKIISEEFNNEFITFNALCSSGMHAIGLHMIDLIRFLFGEVAWVYGVQEEEYVENLPYSANFVPTDPRAHSIIGLENGRHGMFSNTACIDFTYFELEIILKSGKVRVSNNGELVEVWTTSKPGSSTLSYNLSIPNKREFQKESLFLNATKSIYDVLRNGKKNSASHPLSAENGLNSYIVLDSIVQSSKNGGKRVEV